MGCIQSIGSQRVRHNLVAEQQCKHWQCPALGTLLPLLPSKMVHTLSMECVSFLNRPLSLEYGSLLSSLLYEAKKPHLAAVPRSQTLPGIWPPFHAPLFFQQYKGAIGSYGRQGVRPTETWIPAMSLKRDWVNNLSYLSISTLVLYLTGGPDVG